MSLNLEPPAAPEPEADPLSPGSGVYVDLNGVLYPGVITAILCAAGEISVETPAAHHMSRHWKTLLFYIESRKAVYGLAKLVIPGIDPVPPNAQHKTQYEKKTQNDHAPLDEPEALSRDEDSPEWEQKSTLEPDEEEKLWYQID